MKISVKLLKGELFSIEADSADTVTILKNKIQEARSELAADRQKLIHAGKVLKDTQTVAEIGVTEADFIVCMVSKEVAAPKPKVEPTAAPAPAPAPAAAPVPAPVPTPVAPAPTVTAPAPAPVAQPPLNPEAIAALTGMGFPEPEVRAALTAAMGNADLAYEFLLTGIPAPRARAPVPVAPQAQSGVQQLRSHPQFNMLKQLIQSNPASLPQVLQLIGQQSPALLQAIHENESEFLAMMNEPITDTPTVSPAQPQTAPFPGAPGAPGMPNPAQIMQMLATMPEAQRAQFAQSLGLNPEQLNMAMQMMAQMPPDQLQQLLGGAGGLGRAPPPGSVTLTHEEMESVNRLMALGFSQQQALQAYIACDRNENLAANFLFENGWGDDGGFDDMGGEHDHDHDDGDDDMYN